jgi:hypothetical protein
MAAANSGGLLHSAPHPWGTSDVGSCRRLLDEVDHFLVGDFAMPMARSLIARLRTPARIGFASPCATRGSGSPVPVGSLSIFCSATELSYDTRKPSILCLTAIQQYEISHCGRDLRRKS